MTVYDYDLRADSNYFIRTVMEDSVTKKTDQNPIPSHIPKDSLMFESRFESGNLARATRMSRTYYELQVRPDLFTSRHCLWFYFRVTNMVAGVQYRLSLVNLLKSQSH